MARNNFSPEKEKKEKKKIKELYAVELTKKPSCEIQQKCLKLN